MKVEVDIKSFLKAINEFHIAEQQPCGVQVVEWVGFSSYLMRLRQITLVVPLLIT